MYKSYKNYLLKGLINKSNEFIIDMLNILSDNGYYRTEEDLDSARITYTISTDLVDTASGNDKIKDNALWLGIIESFAIALSSYENMLDKRRLDQRETDHDPVSADHLQVFQEKRNLVIRKLKQHSLLDDGKKYLKVCCKFNISISPPPPKKNHPKTIQKNLEFLNSYSIVEVDVL